MNIQTLRKKIKPGQKILGRNHKGKFCSVVIKERKRDNDCGYFVAVDTDKGFLLIFPTGSELFLPHEISFIRIVKS